VADAAVERSERDALPNADGGGEGYGDAALPSAAVAAGGGFGRVAGEQQRESCCCCCANGPHAWQAAAHIRRACAARAAAARAAIIISMWSITSITSINPRAADSVKKHFAISPYQWGHCTRHYLLQHLCAK
jgi:hypothetical protein